MRRRPSACVHCYTPQGSTYNTETFKLTRDVGAAARQQLWQSRLDAPSLAPSVSSAVHRLAGQLVERGVPSRVALVLAHNGVEPKDLASTPVEEALSAARAESITLNSLEERKLRTLCAQAAPSAAPAAPTVAPEPNAAIAPADWPSQDEIVYLSVGGTPFTTRRSTLCKVPDSMLANLFTLDNGFREPDKDGSGACFLDRDPSVFAWVLCYLRLSLEVPVETNDVE